MDLVDYASSRSNGNKRRRCLTCALDHDIVVQINKARSQSPKIPFPVISKWLDDEHGAKIQPNTIRNHFVARHDND